MTDAETGQRLVGLWRDLAAQLGAAAPRSAALGGAVIERFQSEQPDRARHWIDQARALAAWHSWKSPVLPVDTSSEWAKLLHASTALVTRNEEQIKANQTRRDSAWPLTSELVVLLTENTALLRRCCAVFQAESQRAASQALIDAQGTSGAEHAVDAFLAAQSPRWRPKRLWAFQQHVREIDEPLALGLWDSAEAALSEHGNAWRQSLRDALALQDDEVLDSVVLLRALLDALLTAPVTLWPALVCLAHDLVPQQQLAIELIRDFKQPTEWFVVTQDGMGSTPEVTCVGWALRTARKPWFCFPPGRLRMPRPEIRTPSMDAATQIEALVNSNGWLTPVTPCVAALRAHAVSGQADGAEAAARSFLDCLVQTIAEAHHGTEAATSLRKLPKTHTYVLDQMLAHFRRWCGHFGMEILPRAWNFAGKLQYAELHDDERNCAFFFRADENAGSVYRVRSFGLKQGERLLSECALSVAAGPAPAGMQELDEVIKVAVDHGEEVLVARLRGWREAAFHGALDIVIVQFFVDYWGELGEELRQQHPELAHEFSLRLFDLLKLEFKLFPFFPVAYQDHPDGWLQRATGRSMVTGRVRRVVRPGLQDENGLLRVPALVEVE